MLSNGSYVKFYGVQFHCLDVWQMWNWIFEFCVQIHGALITFVIAIQWKCENLLREKYPNFTERNTPQGCL